MLISTLFSSPSNQSYNWLKTYDSAQALGKRIALPNGYERVNSKPGSFAHWLQGLPLKQGRPPVYLYNGSEKGNQQAHFAVVDIDVGSKDLQQCADAVMRLRAEYLYSLQNYAALHFNFTSGDRADFGQWIKGYRAVITGRTVKWVKQAAEDSSYQNLRQYLNTVFTYAGSFSLSKELQSVRDINDLEIGDVFIQGGFPGHAVIVVDMAMNKQGEKIFLLAQSYMPAQQIHILKNPNDAKLDPWYSVNFTTKLYTPEWTFTRVDLKRF